MRGAGESGQATVEYAAIALLVAMVLGSAAALTSGGLGGSVEAALRRGICSVSSSQCPRLVAAAMPPDLAACTLARKNGTQQLLLDVGVVRLAAQLGLIVERMSDGRVRISFADGGRAGLGAAVGAHLQLGKAGGRWEAAIDGGAAVTSGRVWVLPNAKAAERFVARFGEAQQLAGRLKQDVAAICLLCGSLIGAPGRPPAPDERWVSGGLAVGASAGASAGPIGAKLDASLRTALGRRVTRDGTTWFVRLDDRISGMVDALGGGLDGQFDGAALAALQLDRFGSPVRLTVTTEQRLSSRQGLRLPVRPRRLIGDTRSGSGSAVDVESVLELNTAADRKAALSLLAGIGSLDLPQSSRAVGALRAAIAQRGSVTVRRWRLSRRLTGIGAGAALGVRLGADASSSTDDQRLAAVSTKLNGIGWLPRADCLAV